MQIEAFHHRQSGTLTYVAYDASADVYCVVWQEFFSSNNSDIRARRISGLGSPLGSMPAMRAGPYSTGMNSVD